MLLYCRHLGLRRMRARLVFQHDFNLVKPVRVQYFNKLGQASLVFHAFALFQLHCTNGSPNTDHQEDEDVINIIFILTLPPFSQAVVDALLLYAYLIAELIAKCSFKFCMVLFNLAELYPYC